MESVSGGCNAVDQDNTRCCGGEQSCRVTAVNSQLVHCIHCSTSLANFAVHFIVGPCYGTDLLSSSLCYSRRVQDTILMDLLKVKHVGRYHSSADRADPRFSCSYLVYTPPIKTIALFLQIFYVGPFVTTPLTSLCLTQTQLCTSFCGANDRALASLDCCMLCGTSLQPKR